MTTRKCNEAEAYMLELAHKLDAIEPTARAMLAALKRIAPLIAHSDLETERRMIDVADAAIAKAEAAGIKAE